MESANESGILRTLRDIQRAVPDREFFTHNKLLGQSPKSKKKNKGGFRLIGGKRKSSFDVETGREKVKAFHNSFLAIKRGSDAQGKSVEFGTMSISDMKDFRGDIRLACEDDSAGEDVYALNAIVTYIDLKNSGIISEKQSILQDCLKKIGLALQSDGGLSMFHTTWFLTIYREYISRFKMFPRGEYHTAVREGSGEAQAIAKRLHRKQFEITQYLGLIDEKVREVRIITQYSQQEAVKRSIHGQRGCGHDEIKRMFAERLSASEPATVKKGQVNEVSIIMAYALLFARIPMLTPVVELIRSLIPSVNVEGILSRQKIAIAQKQNMLEIARGVFQTETDQTSKKLYLLAESVYKYCVRVVADNNLEKTVLKSDIYAHPILKQAVILITYKNIFRTQKDAYISALNKSKTLLQSVKSCSNSGHKALRQMADHADVYEKNINNIITQVQTEHSAGYDKKDFGKINENW